MNRLRVAGLLVLSALVTSCGLFGGGDGSETTPPSSSSTAPSSSTSAGGSFEQPFAQKVFNGTDLRDDVEVTTSVYGIYRQGEYAVLQFGVSITGGNAEQAKLYDFLRPQHPPSGYETAQKSFASSGVTLVDPTQKKVYLAALDSTTDGECVCAEQVGVIKGATSVGTVTFKAPTDAKNIDVSMMRLGYFPGVPVTDSAPPTPSASPQAGSTVPAFVPLENSSDGPPARADVLDLDTPISNLDLSVTQQRDRVVLAGDVLFEFNKATLRPDAKPKLAEVVRILKKEAKGPVKINGYTDSKGSNSYNLSLSKRRAETVKKILAPALKGTGITLTTKGYGEADPVAANTRKDGKDNPGGRKQNRRVEVVYTK